MSSDAAAAPIPEGRIARFFAGQAEGMPRTFWFLFAGTLINRAGSFVIPFLSIYLTSRRNVPIAQVGFILSLWGLGSAISAPLGGFLADRVGRRATMLSGLVFGAAAMLALGYSESRGQLALSCFLLGLLADLYRPASQAAVADVVEPRYRMKAFGLMYWAINLGFAMAAIIAGQVAPYSFKILFIADAATTLIYAALLWRFVPETKPAAAPAEKKITELRGFIAPFVDLPFLGFFLVSIPVAMIFLQHNSTMPVQMKAAGVDEGWYGGVIAINGILIIALQPWLTRRLERTPRSKVLAVAAVLTGIGFGINAFAHAVGLFALSVAVWTIGEIIMSPVSSSVVADLAPTQLRGRYQGAFMLCWSLSAFAAPLVGSLVMGKASPEALWLGCLGVGVLAAIAHLLLAPARRKRVRELIGEAARPD